MFSKYKEVVALWFDSTLVLFSRMVVSLGARRVKKEIIGALEKLEANGRYDGLLAPPRRHSIAFSSQL